jgi:predicted Zn-dependent protease
MILQAYLHLEQRKPESACQMLRLLFRLFPDDAEVQRCLALGELMAGRPVEAARVATRALQKSPDTLRIPVGLVFAKALWEQGKHESAREFLASLLSPKN